MLQARYIEKRLSKDQILELYLNIVYYGPGAYGITDASDIYFDAKPSELETYQCVALCVFLPAPSVFNPFAERECVCAAIHLLLGENSDSTICSFTTVQRET